MAPPTNTEDIIFQLAMPVQINNIAPRAIAMTLVSPTEPGINPYIISIEKSGTVPVVAVAPRGVATVRPSIC